MSTDAYAALLAASGHDPRPQQAALVGHLRGAAHSTGVEGRVIVQAGTGVGKTIAALAAAAEVGRPGRPAIVAVFTNGLLDQYAREAARLRQATGARMAVVKGRRHYVCASSVAARRAGVPQSADWDDRADVAAVRGRRTEWLAAVCSIRPWASQWELGDRAAAEWGCPGSAADREEPEPDECPLTVGRRCGGQHKPCGSFSTCVAADCAGGGLDGCGALAARDRAKTEAAIVLTNLDLLAMGEAVLPPMADRAFTIVDEAHELPGKVIERRRQRISGSWGTRKLAPRRPARDATPEERQRTAHGDVFAERLRLDVHGFREGAIGRPSWNRESRYDTEREAVPPTPTEARLLAALGALCTPPGSLAELVSAADPLANRVLTVHRDESEEVDPQSLYVHPAEVEGDVAEMLGIPAALISATVPDTLARRCGWPTVEPVNVGTPFDYGRQMRVWVSRRSGVKRPAGESAEAREQRMRARAAELAEFAGDGGLLVLCTAWEDVRLLERLLVPTLEDRGLKVFVQPRGAGSAAAFAVADQFEADGDAVLIGVGSYATGLDKPGRVLRRLAWWSVPTPQDGPLERRIEAVYPGFKRDEARLLFVQGLGRGVRRGDDAVEVLICDARGTDLIREVSRTMLGEHLRPVRVECWGGCPPVCPRHRQGMTARRPSAWAAPS